jgi:RNA polymerase sigma factor (sigma-70 family)
VKYTEEELIEGVRRNDDRALAALYKMHYSTIQHFIFSNSGTEQEARDIYQEAFIVLYEKLKTEAFVLQVKVKTFLYSVCRNLWLKRLAERKKFVVKVIDIEETLDLQDILPQAEDDEARFRHMGIALSELGEPCRSLIEDFYIHGNSMNEIVVKYRYTNTDNAKNQKYKCLQRLKKLFFSKYSYQEN